MASAYGTFGNFLLLKERAEDGLGSLWRAGEMERGGFKRIVWLRRFDGVGLDRAALESEVPLHNQLAQTFKAANVVRNASCGTQEGVPYLVWDYVPSQPLDQLMARVEREQFPVAIDNALLITEKICAALAAALVVEVGGEPLVHGFLVPHMVMVGNDGEAQVAGFGLGRGLLANLDRVAVQHLAAPYLAPEALASQRGSRRADVYSLGAILFQLLTGQTLPADPGSRPAALAGAQLHGGEGPIPADIMVILHRALAPRMEERFGSATEFKKELEKLLYGGAYSPTTFNLALFMDRLYRLEIEEEDRDLQRERGIDVTPYYKPPESASGEVAVAAPPPSRTGLYVALGGVAVLLAVIAYLLFGRPAPQKIDEEAQKRMLSELVSTQVAEALRQKEAELEQWRKETETLRTQLQAQQKATTTGTRKLTPEEVRQQEALAQQLAQREAEQKKREADIARLREESAKAATVKPTAAPVVPTAAPIATLRPEVAASPPPVSQPTSAPVAVATQAPAPAAAPAAPGTGLGEVVREGDYVPFAQVDVPPQELVRAQPTLPRAAVMARAGQGVVILRATVNEKGTVDAVEVLRGFPSQGLGVDEACVQAVKQYRFKPATKGGVKVKTDTTVTLRIDLTRGR